MVVVSGRVVVVVFGSVSVPTMVVARFLDGVVVDVAAVAWCCCCSAAAFRCHLGTTVVRISTLDKLAKDSISMDSNVLACGIVIFAGGDVLVLWW